MLLHQSLLKTEMCEQIKKIFKTSANSVIDENDDKFKVRNVLSTNHLRARIIEFVCA